MDKHAVSTTSSPYRVMLACEVSLPDPRVQIPRSSGIVKSVSHYTHTYSYPSLIRTLSICSMSRVRWSSCQERRRSFPHISYSTPNPQSPHPRGLMVARPCRVRAPHFHISYHGLSVRLCKFPLSALSCSASDATCYLQPPCHSVNYTKQVAILAYTKQNPD